MQDDTALYGAKMMQPGMTAADSEEKTYFDLEYCFKMYVRKTKLKEIVDLL